MKAEVSKKVTANPADEKQLQGFIAKFDPDRQALIRTVR